MRLCLLSWAHSVLRVVYLFVGNSALNKDLNGLYSVHIFCYAFGKDVDDIRFDLCRFG